MNTSKWAFGGPTFYNDLMQGARRLVEDISRWDDKGNHRMIVLIAGPTAAGKKRFIDTLGLPDPYVAVLNLDRYYFGENEQLLRFGKVNFSLPSALDSQRIYADIAEYQSSPVGSRIMVPIYSMKSSKRVGEQDLVVRPWLFVKGVYAIQLIKLDTPFRVYIDASEETMLARKLDRDVKERGISEDTVRERFEQNVRPATRQYVIPQRADAAYIIRNG